MKENIHEFLSLKSYIPHKMLFVCYTAADMLRYRTKDILIIMFGKTVRIFVLNLNFDDFDLAEIHNKQSADTWL